MKRKIVFVASVLVFVLSLTGCGEKQVSGICTKCQSEAPLFVCEAKNADKTEVTILCENCANEEKQISENFAKLESDGGASFTFTIKEYTGEIKK